MVMLPMRSEKILQDTKNVRGTLVKSKNRTLFFVFILFAIAFIGLVTIRYRQTARQAVMTQSAAEASEPTPVPLTNTFVDALFGEFIHFQGGSLQSVHLPDRTTRTIVGVGDKNEIALDDSIVPVWSPDGRYLAVATKESKIVVTEFDTGRFVGSFPFPKPTTSQSIVLSIDPASEILALSTSSSSSIRDHSIQFYSLLTQQKLGVYPGCSGNGVFVTGVGYASLCAVGDAMTVSVIRFEPNSSLMTTIARESSGTSYVMVDEYQPGILLMQRMRGSTKELITMSMSGSVRVIPPKEYAPVKEIGDIVDATGALRRRIEIEAKTKSVRSVSVSKDSRFVVFETADGIFVAPLSLKEKPFLLGSGTMPLVRPD